MRGPDFARISVHEGPFDPVSTWIHQEYAEAAAAHVLGILGRAAVPVLAVKGFALARTLYPDVADRPMVDVDFRVPRRRFRHAARALRREGLVLDRSSAQLGALAVRWRGVLVELESSIGPPGSCALSVDDLLARSSWCEAKQLRFRVPELHDHTLVLCINAYKDLLNVRPWAVEDFSRIASQQEFSPRLLAERAERAGLRALVRIVAEWLLRQREEPQWRAVLSQLGPSERMFHDWLFERTRRSNAPPELRMLVGAAGNDLRVRQAAGVAFACAGASLWKLRRILGKSRPALVG